MVRLASHAVHVAAPRRIQQRALPLRCEAQSVKFRRVVTGFLHRSSRQLAHNSKEGNALPQQREGSDDAHEGPAIGPERYMDSVKSVLHPPATAQLM